MSLGTLIQKYVISLETEKKIQTNISIKNNSNLKQLSKYISGGISKLTKNKLKILTDSFISYKRNKFFIDKKEIKPDNEQIKIIKSPKNYNIRVIAGAGTGKTTTICCRIKYLLDYHTTPDRILILTFNIEARKNLVNMMCKLMGVDIKIEIRTIDSFCSKIKNDFNREFNYDTVNNYSLNELGICGRKIMEKYGEEICSQYKYVFFDEFQDVNEDQFQILKCFVNNGCKLTVIGDDSQNIYQFRGSDNYYIINFDKIFSDTLTYKITTNYRSTKQIIDLANDSIINNKEKIYKMMISNTHDNGIIDLTINDTEELSIELIIKYIEGYISNTNISYDNIAILSRNTYSLKHIETEFEKKSIPYVALISDLYSNDYKQIIQENKIVLSTIHRAKGLEWKVVFVVGLCDDHFPSHLNNNLINIEEERRLFYVAVTRAKQYLHFISNSSELPLSRFIDEIKKHIRIENKLIEKHNNNLFDYIDDDKKKGCYSVTKVIEMLSGIQIEKLRDMQLIPNINPDITQLFTEPLCFTDEIKKNVFESDYGIYCDYYLTRQLMIQNNQPIIDTHVDSILLKKRIYMTPEETSIYICNRHDFKKYLIKKNIPKKKNSEKKVKVYQKIENYMKKYKINQQCIDNILSLRIKYYNYPNTFINELINSYEIYKNINHTNNDNMKDAIYYMSLCPKFSDNRRRLVYRDIRELYKENSIKVFPRIDEYVQLLKDDDILCKIHMHKNFDISDTNNKNDTSDNTVYLVGELDYLNITKNTIVDIKCSSSEFKIEWLIQLLIYYSLFMYNQLQGDNENESKINIHNNIDIKKLAIINIFSGKYYEIEIPKNYDYIGLLNYIKEIISDDLKGIREKHKYHTLYTPEDSINVNIMIGDNKILDDNINVDEDDDKDEYKIIQILDIEPVLKTGYIVVDVENNCMNQDIIQLAYIVYDSDHKEVKRNSKFIKDRFVDNRSQQITNISTDDLRRLGVQFDIVMEEFLTDLSKVIFMCGHHVYTDISKIISNMEKYKIKPSFDILKTISIKDTSILYKSIKENKNISLSNMYNELCGESIINAHNALSDAEHTGKCYFILQQMIDKKNTSKIKIKSLKENKISKIKKKSLYSRSNNANTLDCGLTNIMNVQLF